MNGVRGWTTRVWRGFAEAIAIVALGVGTAVGAGGDGVAPFFFGSATEGEADRQRTLEGYCFYRDLPPAGYAPIEFRLSEGRLARSEPGIVECRSTYGSRRDAVSAPFSVPVGGVTRILAPLVPTYTHSGHGNLAFRFRGSAFSLSPLNMARRRFENSAVDRGAGFFIALSQRATFNTWDSFPEALGRGKAGSQQLNATRVAPALLGGDWRALVGVDVLWLAAEEWKDLAAESQEAIMDWASRGGLLAFSGCDPLRDGAVPPAGGGYTVGFGGVIAAGAAEAVTGLEFARLYNAPVADWFGRTGRPAAESAPVGYGNMEYRAGNWMPLDAVGVPELDWGWLILFVALLAVLIGPVNLFLFARGNRRLRILWTTPLIAVAASALLAVLMVARDGFGGEGERVSLVLLDPVRNREVALVEQAARTAILMGSAFETEHPVFMMPLPLAVGGGAGSDLRENGLWRDGWFRSRTLETHLIERVRPSRAGVTIRKRGDVMEAVVSLDADLDTLVYCAPDGSFWGSQRGMKRGTQVELQKLDATAAAELPREAARRFGPRLADAWRRVRERPGWFFGVTSSPAGHVVVTSGAIRWKDAALICGPADRSRDSAQ